MTNDLFDMTALMRNRRRARQMSEPALFLHELAADQVSERLTEVNRQFISPAVVTAFPDVWAKVLPGIKTVTEADLLDFEPGAHDLVIHALSLHWSNDPVGQMIQCRNALKPDGLFMGVMFGGRSLQELRASLAEAESRLSGGLSPRVAPMAELRDLGGLLMRAGLALPVADGEIVPVTYSSLPALIAELRAMGETNALKGRVKGFSARSLFDEAAKIYADNFSTPEGRLSATVEMIYLTGWAPSETQRQPLRPGSAQARLADVLGTKEHAAGDLATNPDQRKP